MLTDTGSEITYILEIKDKKHLVLIKIWHYA